MQLYFYELNILYLTGFSVRSSISELEAVHIFRLKGPNPYDDGHTDIMVDIYMIQLYFYEEKKHSTFHNIFCSRLFLSYKPNFFFVRHTDIMYGIYSWIFMNQTFYIFQNFLSAGRTNTFLSDKVILSSGWRRLNTCDYIKWELLDILKKCVINSQSKIQKEYKIIIKKKSLI